MIWSLLRRINYPGDDRTITLYEIDECRSNRLTPHFDPHGEMIGNVQIGISGILQCFL